MGRFECEEQDWLSQGIMAETTADGRWMEEDALAVREDWTAKGETDRSGWVVDEVQCPTEATPVATVVLPDAGEGLRKSPIRCDLTVLEAFLCSVRQWAVFGRTLCLYRSPCWIRLDEHAAEVEIRKCLRECGFGAPLLSSDYRELRKMLLLNPELQQQVEPNPPELALNLADGTLDVLTGEWRSHDPADGFFSFLDMTLEEVVSGKTVGAFESFVKQISEGDEDIRRQLLELVGLAVTGYPIKNFFVLVGPSHTGKSQLGRFIGELLGREYVETLRGMEDFGDKWTMGALRGKKLAMCLDLPDEPLPPKAVGAVKQLVGDDAVKGEYKGGALFTFYEKPLLLCAGNYPIRLPRMEREQALLNRMVVIPFANPVSPGEERQHFYQALLDDAPYIVSCAIEAVRDLAARNFQVTRSKVPEEYQPQEGNMSLKSVKAFLKERCCYRMGAEVSTRELLEAYSCADGAVSISATEFARLLSLALSGQSDVEPVKRVGKTEQRGYRGIALYSENGNSLELP